MYRNRMYRMVLPSGKNGPFSIPLVQPSSNSMWPEKNLWWVFWTLVGKSCVLLREVVHKVIYSNSALASSKIQDTVGLGKGSDSKGKQHYKCTASETQTHNQWSQFLLKKITEYPPSSWEQAQTSAWPPLTLVLLALHGNAVMFVTPEAVTL